MTGTATKTTKATTAKRPGYVLLVMCAGMFLILLDATVVNVAVPAITAGLRTGTAGVQWVVDAYTVALASLLLTGGTLGDRFGHRTTVLAGLLIFGAASAGCALAPAPGALIAARAAQGVGGALLLPGSLAAIADVYPGRAEQARALGLWAAISSLALPAGPLLGGLIVSEAGWRTVFWINPPVTILCAVGVLACVPPARPRTVQRRAVQPRAVKARAARPSTAEPRDGRPGAVQRLDLAGLASATIALAAAVYTVIAAGAGTWPAVAVAAPVAVLAATAFIYAERTVVSPLIPPAVFRSPSFGVANASALIMNLTANGVLFLLTRYFQSVLGHSAMTAGFMLLPLFAPMAVLSAVAGRLTARRGPRPVMIAGATLAAAGMLGLVAVTPGGGYWRVFPALAAIGVGLGTFVAPVVATAIRAVPSSQSGLASGINNMARQVGTALGVAVFGAVAGSPAAPGHFVAALRVMGGVAALLWLLVIAATAAGATRPTNAGG